MNPKVIDWLGLHRGRNMESRALIRAVTDIDYSFDFRGIHNGSKLNPLWLLLKAWITSREVPQANHYLIEGGMVFWLGYFLKRRYPKSKLHMIVPEPAFYLDSRKNWLQKLFFNYKINCMKKYLDAFYPVVPMVEEDGKRLLGSRVKSKFLPYSIEKFERSVFESNKNILFVIDRPNDSGHVKGLDKAIEIFKSLAKLEPEARLYLVGAGTDEIAYDHPRIKGLGFQEMQVAFNKASIIISPARYDCLVRAVGEGIYAGLIPIVSQNAGIKLAIDQSFVIGLDDIDKWVDKIREVFSYSKEKRESLFLDFSKELSPFLIDSVKKCWNKKFFQ